MDKQAVKLHLFMSALIAGGRWFTDYLNEQKIKIFCSKDEYDGFVKDGERQIRIFDTIVTGVGSFAVLSLTYKNGKAVGTEIGKKVGKMMGGDMIIDAILASGKKGFEVVNKATKEHFTLYRM